MLDILLSALYGIVQGLTEFLPVSSSGHLSIMQNIFKLESFDDRILFTVLLHLGTLVAVFIAYWRDIVELIISFFSLIGKIFRGKARYRNLTSGEKFVVLVIIATCPLVVGAVIDSKIEALMTNTKLIGAFLLINSVILFISDKIVNGNKTVKNTSPKNALYIGFCQIIAVLPGISRSGTTITAGLMNGLTRQFAVKFSFIMSIPAILGANVFKLIEFAESGEKFTSGMIASCATGLIAALISGLFAIVLLRKIARKRNFYIFSIYCAIIGIVAIIFG